MFAKTSFFLVVFCISDHVFHPNSIQLYPIVLRWKGPGSCWLKISFLVAGAGVDVADIVLTVSTFNVARGFIVGAAYSDFASVNCAMWYNTKIRE